jgi:hypothetical protein
MEMAAIGTINLIRLIHSLPHPSYPAASDKQGALPELGEIKKWPLLSPHL